MCPAAVFPPRSLGSVFAARFWLKTAGVSVFTVFFFLGYFWVQRHPLQAVATMPLTLFDRLIPFTPAMVVVYFSLWLYLSLCAGLSDDLRVLALYGVFAGALGLVGLGIFLIWPTAVPHFDVDWAAYPSLSFLKTVDQTGNACPSLHVAYSVYSALWADHVFRRYQVGWGWRVGNLAWCLGILYSTVAIRQHVVIDVVTGAALGALVALAFLGVCRRLGRPA